MKIIETYTEDTTYCGGDTLEIEINGKHVMSVGGGEPEDNSISRDLSFTQSITDWMKLAWQAGQDGEPFDLAYVNRKDDN